MNRLSASLFALVLVAVSVVFAPVFAQANQPIETFFLDNGLQVVVLPNHRVAAVNHMIWYRVGAADDPQGKSGLAHFHEHIMFKGTEKFKDGEYSALLDKNGGEHNAFTGYDATSYYVTIAKDRLPLVMELEADRMRGLTVSDDGVEKERQVIIEERRQRTENKPEALLDEQLDAALFRNHPYRLPMIGWRHEMESLTKQDVLAFHRRYYHPNNAVLVVSGDVSAAEIKPLVQTYYGGLKKGEIPERSWLSEPPQLAQRRVILRDKHVKQPSFTRRYVASSMASGKKEQSLPLFALAYVLGGSNSSVLYQKLVVEKKLAAMVDVGYNSYALGPAQLSFTLVPEGGVTLELLEKALDDELAEFFKSGVPLEDLARAKKLMRAEAIFAREGLQNTSNRVGWLMMAGQTPDYINRWPDLIAKVTAEEMMQAAKETLVKQSSVTGYLLPEEPAL